jgi:hypothetical protein
MSALTNTLENELLEHILNNANIALIGDATGLRGSATAGSLYVSLHTSDPGEAGDQTTNECAYTDYARVAVARSGAGWTVTNGTAVPAANIDFPPASGGTETATHFGIGTASSGAGKLILKGAISPNIAISSGVTPRLTTATAIAAA